MKKTLRLMGLCTLAVLALAGCKKNEQTGTKTFKATISQLNSDAKTEIGTGNWLVWSDNDQIKVYNADKTETATFNIETGVGTKEATFSGTLPESNTYYAFYPTTGVELTPEYVTEFTLSGTQTFVEGNFASNLYPMYAISTDGNFSFYSPCGVLGIPMKGTATIGSILLTDSLGMDLAGTFEMAGADVNFQDTHSGVGITLSFGEGLTLNETTATLVYFVVPAGALSNGFKADVKGTDGNRIVLLETSTPNPVTAETIHLMPEVTGVNDLVPTYTVSTDTATLVSPSPISFTINGSYSVTYSKDVTEVGFYYGPGADLTTKVQATVGTSFSYTLDNLTKNTVYSYQAYIKQGEVEIQGAIKTFRTPDPRFTVNVASNLQVYLASGNLQYQASSNTWRFAEHAWDFVGGTASYVSYGNVYEGGVKCKNNSISNTYSGWIDLYGWGTKNNPTETNNNDDPDEGTTYYDVYSTTFSDWGDNIEPTMQWRTLTGPEWACMLGKQTDSRTTYGYFDGVERVNSIYAFATVEGVVGVVVFPDVYYHPAGVTVPQYFGDVSDASQYTVYTEAEWNQMEANGAAFLPQRTGYRSGTSFICQVNNGYYWTATYQGSYKARRMTITSTQINASHQADLYFGYAVRLARNAE